MRMNSVLTAVLFLASFAGPPGKRDYLESRDPDITILGSQLTGLVDWLGCHIIAKLIFVAFSQGAEISLKGASLAHVIRALVLYPDFTSSLLTSPIFQSPPSKHKISAPLEIISTSLY